MSYAAKPPTPLPQTLPEAVSAAASNAGEFLHSCGFAVVRQLLGAQECAELASLVAPAANRSGGTRCLLDQGWCAGLAQRLCRTPEMRVLLPPAAATVQCTYFEKSAVRNWQVPLHQDVSTPVAARVDSDERRGWSHREGVLLVQAPLALLHRLLIVRRHLDPCVRRDGPLQVLPAMHGLGRQAPEATRQLRATRRPVRCDAAAGDAVVMRPLLLHRSSRSSGPGRRRILHFVFGPSELPLGLCWLRCGLTGSAPSRSREHA